MINIVCVRCGHSMSQSEVACPACGFAGPAAAVSPLSAGDAAKIAEGLLAPGWDANGSEVA